MCLSLPCNLGGFGLPRPVLNHRLNLTRSEQVVAGRSFVKCDLYWENGNLGVEYDSDREHTGSDRISSDAARRGALAFANTTVITITRRQYNNLSQMTAIAKELAKLLGVQSARAARTTLPSSGRSEICYTQAPNGRNAGVSDLCPDRHLLQHRELQCDAAVAS